MHSPRLSTRSSRPIGSLVCRPAVYSSAKLLYLLLADLPKIYGAPFKYFEYSSLVKTNVEDPKDGEFWIYIGVALALVLLGGAFAGLTIA